MWRIGERCLSTTAAAARHPKVDWLLNDKTGDHHYFRLHPNSRPPPAALMMLDKKKRTWRYKGGAQDYLIKTRRRRKFVQYQPWTKTQETGQVYDGLMDLPVIMVKHEDLRPANYIRFKIDRSMTKYDLYRYLDELYEVKMAHIDLEVVEPIMYNSRNVDHPEDRSTENYSADRMFHENSPDWYSQQLTGYNANEGTTRREVIRETPGHCIAHCYLPKGETFYFPDMFGLEASDAADNTPEAEALEAVQVFSFPENFDVERLYGEHKLEKYRENSDMDDLACGFSGFNFFGAVPEEKDLTHYMTLSKKMSEMADLSNELKTRPEEADAILDAFVGDSAKDDVVYVNPDETDDEYVLAHERLKDRVMLMAHSVAAVQPELQHNSQLLTSPHKVNGQHTYRNVHCPRGRGVLRQVETDELVEVDFSAVQAHFKHQSNVDALLN